LGRIHLAKCVTGKRVMRTHQLSRAQKGESRASEGPLLEGHVSVFPLEKARGAAQRESQKSRTVRRDIFTQGGKRNELGPWRSKGRNRYLTQRPIGVVRDPYVRRKNAQKDFLRLARRQTKKKKGVCEFDTEGKIRMRPAGKKEKKESGHPTGLPQCLFSKGGFKRTGVN